MPVMSRATTSPADNSPPLVHQRQHGLTQANNRRGGGEARRVHLRYASASLTGAVVCCRWVMLPLMQTPALDINGSMVQR